MELRRVLYGYRKDQFDYYIVQEEAAIVKRIFKEYLSGESLSAIAKRLTSECVVFFKDKTQWSKNAVCRILDNVHYTGDEDYPRIIDKETYQRALDLRLGKGGERTVDSPETEYIKEHTVCSCCGSRFTRRAKYKIRERWLCVNGCPSTKEYLDDAVLFSKIRSVLDFVKKDPGVLMYDAETKQYEPTRDIIASEKRIKQLMFESRSMFQPIKKLIVETINLKYQAMEFDPTKEKTKALMEFFEKYDREVNGLDIKLLKKTVSHIVIDTEGDVILKFINGVEISNRQVTDDGE